MNINAKEFLRHYLQGRRKEGFDVLRTSMLHAAINMVSENVELTEGQRLALHEVLDRVMWPDLLAESAFPYQEHVTGGFLAMVQVATYINSAPS